MLCFEHQVCATDISLVGMPKDNIPTIMASYSGNCANQNFAMRQVIKK